MRDGLTWHDKNPVDGRAATAQDIVAFIERNKAGKTLDGADDPNFYRKNSFATVDTAEAVDDSTVRVTLGSPAPLFLNLLAQPFTKVQAPEAVEAFEKDFQNFSSDLVVGTGRLQAG